MSLRFPPSSAQSAQTGFTLIEILAVITIIGIVAAFSGPALQSVLVGSNLNRAGQLVGDHVTLARQEAISRNRDVEVRLIKLKTSQGIAQWSGIQVFSRPPDGTTPTAIGRISQLPEGIILSGEATLSPLLTADTAISGTMKVAGQTPDPAYSGFRMRANGGLDSSIVPAKNFLTVQHAQASGNPPNNYYTLQVNPITGKVTVFRP